MTAVCSAAPETPEKAQASTKSGIEGKESLAAVRTKAEQGDSTAQFNLAVMYGGGQGVTKDEAEAVKWYHKAAYQGHAQAQYILGSRYSAGWIVAKDDAEAVKWYRKAADQGYAIAQSNLGNMYAKGEGVAKDEVEAVKWFRKAAEQGDAFGESRLGEMYSKGEGVTKDETEAAKWFRKVAEQGDDNDSLLLAIRFEEGRGVAKDGAEAVKWFRKAAGQGSDLAQFVLGLKYALGIDVIADDAEAVKWYRRAANQGFSMAQSNLGLEYAIGHGVPKDEVEAYKWFLLASAQADDFARKQIAIIEDRLTADQRAEGQQLARGFKPTRELSPMESLATGSVGQPHPTGTGTGFLITDDGYLITNEHVAHEDSNVRVLTADGELLAKVVKVDRANDLTLLKVRGTFTALPLSSSRGVRLGATVATIGFPNTGLQGFAPKLAKGEIASLSGAQDDVRYFQISVPVQPGNSGGALVDDRGNVVGVVAAKLSQKAALATSGELAENVNYAVKSSYLLSFLESQPEVAAKLRDQNTKQRSFEDTMATVQKATVLVQIYQ